MNRRRRLLAGWTLLCVVVAQLATAAYACPLVLQPGQPPAKTDAVSTPCAEMETANAEPRSALCHEHCKADLRLFDHHSPVAPPACAPAASFLVETIALVMPVRDGPVEAILTRATAPPPYASSARLRI